MPVNERTGREMRSMVEVFGGRPQRMPDGSVTGSNTPAAQFAKSRNDNQGVVANHRANDLAMACPTCRDQLGNKESRLFSKADVGYYCLAGHKWKDFDELMARNPDKLVYRGIEARQEGWEKLTIEMPGSTLQDLKRKFGDRLAATLRSVMDILSGTRYMIIPEEDIKRLCEHTGKDLKNSGELVGAVYSMKTTTKDAVEENDLLKQNRSGGSTSPTAITIDFQDLGPKLLAKAKDWQMDVSEVVREQIVRKYVENGWI